MNYEGPAVKDYGTLVELTEAQQTGNFTDADFPVVTPEADGLVVVGQHEDVIAGDPRPVAAADRLLPGALAGAQVDRRHAAAMADRIGAATVDNRPAANIGETGDRVDRPRRGQIVGPMTRPFSGRNPKISPEL